MSTITTADGDAQEADTVRALGSARGYGWSVGCELLEAIKFTSLTVCADPCDPLFSVMGIIADESWHLKPDH